MVEHRCERPSCANACRGAGEKKNRCPRNQRRPSMTRHDTDNGQRLWQQGRQRHDCIAHACLAQKSCPAKIKWVIEYGVPSCIGSMSVLGGGRGSRSQTRPSSFATGKRDARDGCLAGCGGESLPSALQPWKPARHVAMVMHPSRLASPGALSVEHSPRSSHTVGVYIDTRTSSTPIA